MIGAQYISAVILAGGKSRRMGQDKRRLKLWGEHGPNLLEHTIAIVGQLCAEVVVVLNDAEQWPQLPARCVADAYPNSGPLGGIYTGLCAIDQLRALVVACDMPFLNEQLLSFLMRYATEYDALIPRTVSPGTTRNMSGLEPLHAIYTRACLPALRASLDAGELQIAAFLAAVRAVFVEPHEYQQLDPTGRSFMNLNDAAQLQDFSL